MEIDPLLFWYSCFSLFLVAFLFILYREKDARFLFYALLGALLGYFIFDVPSVALGYYTYVEKYYFLVVYGVPVSMVLAEGFCAAITIYMYEKLPWLYGFLKRR